MPFVPSNCWAVSCRQCWRWSAWGWGITLAADSYAQTQWPGVVFRPLQERVLADLYVVYDEKQATPAVKK